MEYIYGPHIVTTARTRTYQDSWRVHKLVQCVSIQYIADRHFNALGLRYKKEVFLQMLWRPKTFQMECLYS